jgi:hypothetical protein
MGSPEGQAMTYKYRESLITYLAEFPDAPGEIEKLRADGVLNREEVVMVSMRVAASRLERKLNDILEKSDSIIEERDEGLRSYSVNHAVG